MNVNNSKSRMVIIGVAAVMIGAALGVGGMEFGNYLRTASQTEATGTGIKLTASPLFSGPNLADPDQWDPFQEIQKMQARMDQEFNQLFQQPRTQPQFKSFQANPNYSLSLNMQDLKDRYGMRYLFSLLPHCQKNLTSTGLFLLHGSDTPQVMNTMTNFRNAPMAASRVLGLAAGAG